MKLIGLFFTIFICGYAFAQRATKSIIDDKTKKQLPETRCFQLSKTILNDEVDALSGPINKKDSRFRFNLATVETTDLIIVYARKKYEFAFAVEDLFNVDWNKVQLTAKSRLRDEPTPVEKIDFSLGIPLLARLKLTVSL